MTIDQIYAQYARGSQGFCKAVQTHCGFGASLTEIARIAAQAETAADFRRIWKDDASWCDFANITDEQAADLEKFVRE